MSNLVKLMFVIAVVYQLQVTAHAQSDEVEPGIFEYTPTEIVYPKLSDAIINAARLLSQKESYASKSERSLNEKDVPTLRFLLQGLKKNRENSYWHSRQGR